MLQRVSRVRRGTLEGTAGLLMTLPLLFFVPLYLDDLPGLALELLVCLGAALFGRWPVVGGCIVGVALTGLAFDPSQDPRWSSFACAIPIISAGARRLTSLGVVLSFWYLAALALIEMGTPFDIGELVNGVLLWGFLIGLFWAAGQGLHALTVDRERMAEIHVAAVQSQRRSIARDLHDTVAYATTSIILRAEQAKLRGVDPETLADLDYIIAAGRRSMRDLRGMMETLRRNDPEPDAARSTWRIASVEEVIDRRLAELTDNGFTASAHVDADLSDLPESVRETLAKVVVEATANMVKHGDRSGPCSILIETEEDEVEAVFINTPAASGRGPLAGRQNNHLGLVGARERVEALGGECNVTSTSPTWVLRARIPIGA